MDRLDKDIVADTRMWTLAVRFSPRHLHVMAFSDVESNSLISRSFKLETAASSWLRAVEDIVYENPLMLREFRRTILIIEPEASMLMPAGIDTDAAESLMSHTLGGDDREWAADLLPSDGATIGYGFHEGLKRFVARTWEGRATLSCHLTALARYFILNGRRGRSSSLLVNLRENELDVIAVDGHEIRLANTFTFRTVDDAAYYVLACRRFADSTGDSTVQVSGDAAVREQLVPLLRRFVDRVMPVIFPPQMFRAGREAVNLPFDLTVSSLCE